MDTQKYVDQQKKCYETIMEYLTGEDEPENNDESYLLQNIIKYQNIFQEREEFRSLLTLISKISENHHRYHNFLNKVEQILIHYSDRIKQTFTNSDIFKIFENNKRILLFLFEHKIIIPDESILHFIIEKSCERKNEEENDDENDDENEEDKDEKKTETSKNQCFDYDVYFYPEIKNLLKESNSKLIENKIKEIDPNYEQNFNEKRTIGENDSYICEIIRQDSIESFVSYVNRTNISLSSRINPSIYETNSFLLSRKPTLIEYSAFFGSIQIFSYLKLNKIELKPSLWLYAIHSNNAEIISLLENNHVKPPGKNFEKCLKEAIKCHHNNIVDYINNNLIEQNESQEAILNNFEDNIYSYSFQYYNYSFFPDDLKLENVFYYLCKFGYYKLVDLYLKNEDIDYNKPFKETLVFFNLK